MFDFIKTFIIGTLVVTALIFVFTFFVIDTSPPDTTSNYTGPRVDYTDCELVPRPVEHTQIGTISTGSDCKEDLD